MFDHDELAGHLEDEGHAKHTPGPWVIRREKGAVGEYPATIRSRAFGESDQMGDYRGVIVASFDEAHGKRPHAYPETEANANLIAAAPEMLEVLKHVAGAFSVIRDELPLKNTEEIHQWLLTFDSMTRAAIAKAEGASK